MTRPPRAGGAGKRPLRGVSGAVAPAASAAGPGKESEAVVKIKLDGMSRHAQLGHLLHLQGNVGIDQIVAKDPAGGKKLAIPVQAF